MKKQLRIFLFVTMLLLLLGVTVLAVSAAGEWSLYPTQADADAGTNKVDDYDTAGAAIAAITANNQVVKLNGNITLPDTVTMDRSKAYTYILDGGSHTITVTFTGKPVLNISDNVTVKDMTISRSNYSNAMFVVNNSNSVTFHNVITRGADHGFGNFTTPVHITFTGTSSMTDFDYGFVESCNNGTRGGEIIFNSTGNWYAGNDASDKGDQKFVRYSSHGLKFKFMDGNFYTKDAVMISAQDNAWNSPVEITGGTFEIAGSGCIVDYSNSTYSTFGNCYNSDMGENFFKITDGTFNITGGGSVCYIHITKPYEHRDGATAVGNHPQVTISGGTFNGTNASGSHVIKDESTTTSDPATNNVIYNITGGTFTGIYEMIYTSNSKSTINISGSPTFEGRYNGSNTSRIIYDCDPDGAATYNISGGTFSYSTHMFRTMNSNSVINISGGSFSNAGVFLYADFTSAESTTQPTFNITGGTFTGGSTTQWIYANSNNIINLGDPDATGEAATYPRFTGNKTSNLINITNMAANCSRDKSGVLNIYSGTYTDTGTDDNALIRCCGGIVNIEGGTLSTARTYLILVGDRDLLSPVRITGGDFTVTKNNAAIIAYNYTYASSKDVCGQIRATDWAYGNTILKIEGGNFHVNTPSGKDNYGYAVYPYLDVGGIQAIDVAETTNNGLNMSSGKVWADGILDPTEPIVISISGSPVFDTTGNRAQFIRDEGTTRGTTDENGVNNSIVIVYNIDGGSFTGGCAWIVLRDNGIFNITGGTFNSGASTSDDTRYIWIQNPSVAGGQVNISGGSFTETTGKRLFNAAGADLTITGGTFTAKTNLLNISDGDMPSNVTITGGTFRSTSTDSTILFNAGDSSQNWHEGTVRITGGTFLVDNPATASIRYSTAQTHTNYFYIEGGTFDGAISTTVSAAGHKLLITGGRFKADSGFTDYVPGRGYVGVTDDSSYKRVTAANLHGFAGSQMRLGSDLGVYFYVLTIDAVDSGTPSLVVSFDDSTLATLTVYTTPANYPDGSAVESGYTLYRFAFDGLPPQRLGDDLDVVFKLTDVAKFANEFSGLRYCRQVRAANPEDGDLLAITGALLNFGAAAQAYSGYHALTPVNADAADITGAETFSAVSEKLAAYGGTIGAAHFVKTEEQGVAARGVRFDTGIQLYVRVVDTTGSETCTYSIDGGDPVACTKVDLGGNRFAFYTGAITLDHFEDNVTFALSTGETCTYSVQAFVYYYQNLEAKAEEKALARALWAYKTAVVGASFNEWAGFDVADVVNP